MTIYTDVQALEEKLEAFVTIDLPTIRWAQLGSPIVTCESLAVGVTGVREQPLYPLAGGDCQIFEIIDVIAAIARECAFEADDDGNTDVAQVAAVSVKQDADIMALKAWVESLPRPSDALTSHSFMSEGGLAVTTTTTSVYAGWVST